MLADEMGLGKTIQIISLILADRDEVLGNAPPPNLSSTTTAPTPGVCDSTAGACASLAHVLRA